VLAASTVAALLVLTALGSASVLAQTELHVTFTTVDKTYDSTTDATVDVDAGCAIVEDVGTDDVQCAIDGTPTAAFDSPNAGLQSVTGTTGFILVGEDAGDYSLGGASSSATIGQATLTISANADSKTYDGNATSSVAPTISGLQGSTDEVTGATQSFNSKNAGPRTLSVDPGYAVSDGNNGENYIVDDSGTASGTIDQATLDLVATTDSRGYNGTAGSIATPTIGVHHLQGTDTVTGLTQAFDSRDAGARTLSVTAYTVNDGNGGANYDVLTHTAAGSISKAPLDLTAATESRQYNGGVDSSATPTVGAGQIKTGDSITGLDQEFVSKNVLGTGGSTLHVTAWTINDGNGGNNYETPTLHTASGTITKAPLDITAVTQTRQYDGDVDSSGTPSVSGLQGLTDSVTGRTQAYASKNALGTNGSTINVTGYTVNDGNGGGNYTVTPHSVAGTITKAPMVVNAIDNVKTADGNVTAAAIPTTPSTVFTGDSIVGRFSETYNTAAAGINKVLTPAGTVSDGNSGNNYAYTYNPFSTGRIRPNVVASLAFTAQPIDTKINTPILNTCAPGGSPCAAGSASVTVTARDTYGNLAGPGAPGADAGLNPPNNPAINVVIKKDNASGTVIGPAGGTATSAGVASFGTTLNLAGTFTGHLKLYAFVTSPAVNTTSDDFRIVNDLAPCQGPLCKNNIGNGGNNKTLQYLYGQINSGGSYTATTLTTQFVGVNQVDNRCGTNKTINSGVELRAAGNDVATTSNGYMLLIIPKDTLKALGVTSRGTPSFNVCLGTLYLGNGTAGSYGSQHAKWNATGGLATERQDTLAVDGDTFWRYWGAPKNCGAAGLTASDPCIYLRTKQKSDITALITQGILSAGANANMNDADLAIVIRKPSPWDGKGGVY
jgi:trimeric autotransporter adhesin